MSEIDAWKIVPAAKRIVVKIGSSTLTRDGQLRPDKFSALARDVSRLVEMRRQVVVVSSGAITVGAHRLGWKHAGKSIRWVADQLGHADASTTLNHYAHAMPEGPTHERFPDAFAVDPWSRHQAVTESRPA